MASRGRPKAELVLTEEERETLTRWARRRKSSQALALRSRIVLGCAEGLSNKEVAAREAVAQPTVGKWRRRFVDARCDGLVDDPRPGRPASVTAEQVEDVVVATLESAPANATHWSRKSMAERCGLSKSTIGRIWKAFELQPHRSEDFKLSNDPLFVEKVYDIVGLYLDPPEAAVVLCVDEKSQIQALARSQPAFPMMPGMPEKRTHDYVRSGTTSLFAAFDISDGTVITALHRRHRAIEFRKFLATIDAQVPDHLDVHLVAAVEPDTHALSRRLRLRRRRPARRRGAAAVPAALRRLGTRMGFCDLPSQPRRLRRLVSAHRINGRLTRRRPRHRLRPLPRRPHLLDLNPDELMTATTSS